MKVLLVAVNAKYIHSNLAVYDLKAYTENIPVEVELAEYTINQQQEEILRDIYEHKADVVAFSCYIWNLSYAEEIIEDIRRYRSGLAVRKLLMMQNNCFGNYLM